MKVKVTATILGKAYGVEEGLRRGEVIDLAVGDAVEAVARGAAQLDLDGPLRRDGALPSNEELAALAALAERKTR